MPKTHSPRFLSIVNAAREEIQECMAEDLLTLVNGGAVVIDVRETHEFKEGHFNGAIHIGKGVLERDIEKQSFAMSAKIVLYCGGGFRSAIAAKSLKDMGYEDVYSLWGGWRGIVSEGLPTSK
jgi:rhodanese-related sulfurtransferase